MTVRISALGAQEGAGAPRGLSARRDREDPDNPAAGLAGELVGAVRGTQLPEPGF